MHAYRQSISIYVWAALAAFLVLFTLTGARAQAPQSNPLQENIEKTIGSLVVQNAQAQAQIVALNTELMNARKALEDAKSAAAITKAAEPKK